MSCQHYLVCHATKQMALIGQGTFDMAYVYTADPGLMERLEWLLIATVGQSLTMINSMAQDHLMEGYTEVESIDAAYKQQQQAALLRERLLSTRR